MSTIFHLNNAKKKLPVASPRHFGGNPRDNPPIKTLQMNTFSMSGNLECQLRCKICHHPLSDLSIFHSSSTLDDSHPRNSTKQWYKRLVVTCNNDVVPVNTNQSTNVLLFIEVRDLASMQYFVVVLSLSLSMLIRKTIEHTKKASNKLHTVCDKCFNLVTKIIIWLLRPCLVYRNQSLVDV